MKISLVISIWGFGDGLVFGGISQNYRLFCLRLQLQHVYINAVACLCAYLSHESLVVTVLEP